GTARQALGPDDELDGDDARIRQPSDAPKGKFGDACAELFGSVRVAQLEAGGDRPGADRPKPPWPAVLATTVRLWLRRRWAALGRLFRHRWAIVVAVLAVAALVVGGLTVSFLRHAGTGPAAGQQNARGGA